MKNSTNNQAKGNARTDQIKGTDAKTEIKNKKKQLENRKKTNDFQINKLFPRKVKLRDRHLFSHTPRNSFCLCMHGKSFLGVYRIQHEEARFILAFKCKTIEHQIIALRNYLQLTPKDFESRYIFTQLFLTCLQRHHNTIYQGILFGSSVNGLGFRDCDVDLRLRPLKPIGDNIYEPISLDEEMVESILRDIAYQTTLCCPAFGDYVPSRRCPVAKLSFVQNLCNYKQAYQSNVALEQGLQYDISLGNSTLSTFNSHFLRFLCYLEPKFHLLATVIKYWSNVHDLIVPGYLSSYALCNMLIFFCQTQVDPPILPTIDFMRDLCFKQFQEQPDRNIGMTQLQWHCIICLRKELYTPSSNREALSVLLLKFFEFYLKFPYSTHIITTRTGKSLTHDEFNRSTQYHRQFSIKSYLNIQDPFDLKHNLTSGMNGGHFHRLLMTIRFSYEILFKELLNNFKKPPPLSLGAQIQKSKKTKVRPDPQIDWGLNALFIPIPPHQLVSNAEPPKQQDLKKN